MLLGPINTPNLDSPIPTIFLCCLKIHLTSGGYEHSSLLCLITNPVNTPHCLTSPRWKARQSPSFLLQWELQKIWSPSPYTIPMKLGSLAFSFSPYLLNFHFYLHLTTLNFIQQQSISMQVFLKATISRKLGLKQLTSNGPGKSICGMSFGMGLTLFEQNRT